MVEFKSKEQSVAVFPSAWPCSQFCCSANTYLEKIPVLCGVGDRLSDRGKGCSQEHNFRRFGVNVVVQNVKTNPRLALKSEPKSSGEDFTTNLLPLSLSQTTKKEFIKREDKIRIYKRACNILFIIIQTPMKLNARDAAMLFSYWLILKQV